MGRLHYEMINASLHMKVDEKEESTLNKISILLSAIKINVQKLSKLSRSVTIDEAMIGYKGRSKFIFYLPMKPTEWGFKMHCLCDSTNGFCWNFMFDKGKDKEGVKNYTQNLILNLVEGLENSGRIIYMDSWYTSPNLFEGLLKRGILASGIVQPSRKNLPEKSYFEQNNNLATTNHLNLITITIIVKII